MVQCDKYYYTSTGVIIMAIEKKDRSFDKIFDQVTLEKIPMDYVKQVKVNLIDGTTIDVDVESVR